MTKMPDDIRIRPCRREDAEAVLRITAERFEPASIDALFEKQIVPGAVPWVKIKCADVQRELDNSLENSFVAEQGGEIVGYVTNIISEFASRGSISNLAVSARAAGKGVGRRLILRSLEHFRSLSLRQAKIETLDTNEAGKHLYPAVGFKKVATQIHYGMSLLEGERETES